MRDKIISRLSRYRGYILLALAVTVALLFMVNLHLDGSTKTPGTYRIYNKPQNYVLSVVDTTKIVWEYTKDSPDAKNFTLIYLHDGLYKISDESGRFITQKGSTAILQKQRENDEKQLWRIERIGASQYYCITNATSGLSLRWGAEKAFGMGQFKKEQNAYYITFA